jgi:hypothetical protein
MSRVHCDIGDDDESCRGCRQATKGCYWGNISRLGKVFRPRPIKRAKMQEEVSEEEEVVEEPAGPSFSISLEIFSLASFNFPNFFSYFL